MDSHDRPELSPLITVVYPHSFNALGQGSQSTTEMRAKRQHETIRRWLDKADEDCKRELRCVGQGVLACRRDLVDLVEAKGHHVGDGDILAWQPHRS